MERIDEIRQMLLTYKKVLVNDLANRYQVSTVTIRKDLTSLEEEGIAKRVYGGALLSAESFSMISHQTDPVLAGLAEEACLEICDGDNIFLGSGKTCCHLAKCLSRFKNLSVVTNNITALSDLLQAKARVYLLGGEVTSVDNQTLFSSPENPSTFTGNIYVTKAFTSVSGVDMKAGLTVNSIISTYIYHKIPSIARSWYLMADHTKFNRTAMYPVAQLTDLACLISDHVPENYAAFLKERGVELRVSGI